MLNPQLIIGDAREALATLPSRSVRCCVTSPPYWGLRDYGTAQWEGGEDGCDHKQSSGASAKSGLNGSLASKDGRIFTPYRDICGKCGARRIDRQMGLESTPEEYVAGMVAVFREVRRVMTDDATMFLNVGDSYTANGVGGNTATRRGLPNGKLSNPTAQGFGAISRTIPSGLKPKDLVGIPWRLAFALQADGWWLRQDIIWHKPNPMPESVTDRCTKAHEYIFLLTKSARYYWDAEAVSEESKYPDDNRKARQNPADYASQMSADGQLRAVINPGGDRTYPTRNPRSVWTITTKPCAEAHFATFPPELPERCIRAGTAPGDTVLDPFTGAGTTGMVAVGLGRDFVGIELNPKYAAIAERRINDVNPMFVPPIAVRTLSESPTPPPMVGCGIDP